MLKSVISVEGTLPAAVAYSQSRFAEHGNNHWPTTVLATARDKLSAHLLAGSNRLKAIWQLVNTVAVTHPDAFFVYVMLSGIICIQLAAPRGSYNHAAILSSVCCLVDNATELLDHELHPIADAKDRNLLAFAVLKKPCRHPRGTLNVYRIRTA